MARPATAFELHLPRLRSLISQRIRDLVRRLPLHWRDEPNEQRGELPRAVQRFGKAAWQKIAARWPALAALLGERMGAKARRKRASQPAPVPAPAPANPETTDALILQLIAASSWQARAGAALSLAHHPGEDVVQALLRALRDPSVEVAVAAVDALIAHADESATLGLLGVLENHDGYFSPITRVAAISALAQRLQAEHFAPLFAAVRDIDAEVSIAAASVITERMPHAASEQLLEVLRDTSGFYLPIVRLAVANALEHAGILQAGVADELLPAEHDPCVRRVLERASHLSAEL